MHSNDSDRHDSPVGSFFEPGRAYTTQTGYLAPEQEATFACAAVTRTPSGEQIAFGFFRNGIHQWTATGLGPREFAGFGGRGWNPATPPEWLAQVTARTENVSPLAQAEDAKRRRDLGGELGALMQAGAALESAPWYPCRPGDLVHVHHPAVGDVPLVPAWGETYIVGDAGDGLMSLQLLAHTLPDTTPHADGMTGCYAAEGADEPIYEMWFEAGPHLLTIVRDGRPVHVGGAR
ncbi:hypothetical protein [Streptomyces soliscabiei]|uniref:hypothetical protein n=1 Tax=Streptomyces soliscabiei TaxID=588897 RepID=UPI0029A4D605|nr:hypothetical protein [Streptomyces sp. NY05-11A]MDX2681073.1 hypothetical protein [Streptomyces sp. NY05-11A]